MRSSGKLLTAIFLTCCLNAANAQLIPITPPAKQAKGDETHLAALHSTGYARSLRAAIVRNCRTVPSYSGSSLCFNIHAISDEQIEEFALPAFRMAVSAPQARYVLEFWTSRQGREIKRLLFDLSEESGSSQAGVKDRRFSPAQLEAIAGYNNSVAGAAEASFSGNSEIAQAVLQAISEYY
jgi:hypothetical protein